MQFPEFSFNSPLAAAIIDLERLRADLGVATTHPTVFLQLRSLFQLLTSIMSARIEGNRTSILDAFQGVARAPDGRQNEASEGVEEILRLQEAADFVDDVVEPGTTITHSIVRELHRMAVRGLAREGDATPGAYRVSDVTISGSGHRPPAPAAIQGDMTELLDFINRPVAQSYDLLKVAVAHHRFVWIHPFGNGNGRVGRLLTYAIMVSQGFTEGTGYRALNPTTVFGADRQLYYRHLEEADSLEDVALISWCTYLLEGLRSDLSRLKQLGDASFVCNGLLLPAIDRALKAGSLTAMDAHALGIVARHTEIKASDVSEVFPGTAAARSYQIRRLMENKLIEPIAEGKRTYRMVLAGGPLGPFVVRQLDSVGFLPEILRQNFGS